jgi:hypothetical protein
MYNLVNGRRQETESGGGGCDFSFSHYHPSLDGKLSEKFILALFPLTHDIFLSPSSFSIRFFLCREADHDVLKAVEVFSLKKIGCIYKHDLME